MKPETLQVRHIAKAMRLTEAEVLHWADHPRIAYKRARRRQVGAKSRLITAPRWKQKTALRWLGQFLRKAFGFHTAAHGSVPGRSPFTAAARHLGFRNLVSRDVKDAFPNVRADRFYLEMLALGFSPVMATLLTKLLLPDGYLPQGGPTSNAAIDLFFKRTDANITAELAVLRARYTRFTDGLDASFEDAAYASDVGRVFVNNLARLGLRVNQKKADDNGWQPIGVERIMCGVRVNSPRGTQLPRSVIAKLRSDCDSLYRGARSAAPHTLVSLGRRRRSLQGWLNQASQADIAPTCDLQRRLNQVDQVICAKLSRHRIYPNRAWYTKGRDFDEPAHLAALWRTRRPVKRAA